MEFNGKLLELRKQKGLTQEQLAEQLYVSRTAISKWESGKGYPNIESLKSISKLFAVSIDELLSGDELISIAVTENRSKSKIFGYIYGVLDIMAIAFALLPLYGQPVGRYIQAVNLLEYTNTAQIILASYWAMFIFIIGLGITQLIFSYFENEKWRNRVTKISFMVNSIALLLFSAAREPYVTALIFLFFLIKVLTLLSEKQIK